MHHDQVYLHEYITHIQRGLANPYSGVIYGGGTLMHRYGRGFLINFFDKHEGKPVRLYVSKDLMAKGRFGHYIDEILDTKTSDISVYFYSIRLFPSGKTAQEKRYQP